MACSCQKKAIGKMKRRRIGKVNTSSLQKMLTEDLLPTAGGYVLGNLLVDKIMEKASPSNAKYARWVKIGLGGFLSVSQKGMLARAGVGMATAGAVEFATDAISGGIGAFPTGRPAYFISGHGVGATDPVGTTMAEPVRVTVD